MDGISIGGHHAALVGPDGWDLQGLHWGHHAALVGPDGWGSQGLHWGPPCCFGGAWWMGFPRTPLGATMLLWWGLMDRGSQGLHWGPPCCFGGAWWMGFPRTPLGPPCCFGGAWWMGFPRTPLGATMLLWWGLMDGVPKDSIGGHHAALMGPDGWGSQGLHWGPPWMGFPRTPFGATMLLLWIKIVRELEIVIAVPDDGLVYIRWCPSLSAMWLLLD